MCKVIAYQKVITKKQYLCTKMEKNPKITLNTPLEYGMSANSVESALKWIQIPKEHILSPQENAEVSEIIKNALSGETLCKIKMEKVALNNTKDWNWNSNLIKKESIINEFAILVQKNSDTICELEMFLRGILKKYTQKGCTQVCQLLKHYATHFIKHSNAITISLDDNTPLIWLGYVLAHSLSLGVQVFLKTGPKITPLVLFLNELSVKAGVLQGTINVTPVYDAKTVYSDTLPHFELEKTRFIVFDSADINSAIYAVVEAIWGHNGTLPWSTREILVQENIFEAFCNKLKHVMSSLRVGLSNETSTDFSYHKNDVKELESLISDAKTLGLEIFQTNLNKDFKPTLIIGGKVDSNNCLTKNRYRPPFAEVIPFRNISESISLANNGAKRLGAFVWTENISLANELAQKLNVDHVWVNGPAQFRLDLELFAWKSHVKNPIEDNALKEELEKSKIAQISWAKLTKTERRLKLTKLAQFVDENRDNFKEIDINEFIKQIYLFPNKTFSSVEIYNNYEVKSFPKPKGVLLANFTNATWEAEVKFLVAALLEGNSIIAKSANINFYEAISKKLDVITFIKCSTDALQDVKAENTFYYNVEQDLQHDFVNLKNVWTTFGQHYA